MSATFYNNLKADKIHRPKIMVAAGGSGGHIFPAIAFARKLNEKRKDIDILFLGGGKALDRKIFEAEHFKYYLLSSNKLPYKVTLNIFIFFVKLFADLIKSLIILVKYKPDVVVGFGGYVSWPAVFGAYFLGTKRMVHEQNVVPGRANKMLFNIADTICLTFDKTKRSLNRNMDKIVITGNPIRSSIRESDKAYALKKIGLDTGKFTILIMGGSQGSHSMNEIIIRSLQLLDICIKEKLQVIHLTGSKDYGWAADEYGSSGINSRVFSFIDNIEDAYSASDIIITRAGSSAVFEAALFGKPMILIPYPFAGAHQTENASVFAAAGAAIVLSENGLSGDVFIRELTALMADNDLLKKMSVAAHGLSVPDAAGRLADEALKLIPRD